MTKTYGAEINMDLDNAHTRVIRMVGGGKRVLELGCGIGHMSRVFAARGCKVTAIEASADAAEQARASGARIIGGDLETLNWAEALGAERFDVIVAADVLEHLKNPTAVLARAGKYLTEDGAIVASIPNVAHLSVIAELLQGRFRYQPAGLLDDTHLRFFTRDSVYACFEEAGFEIACLERVIVRPEETEFHTELESFPSEIVALLESREEATTYQFIVSAHRCATTSNEVPGDRRERRGESRLLPGGPLGLADAGLTDRRMLTESALEGFLQAVAARWAFVESDRQHHTALVAKLREQLVKSETHIGWLTSETERCKASLDHSRDETESEAEGAAALGAATAQVDALRRDVDLLTSQATASGSAAERLRMEGVLLRADSARQLGDLARQLEDVQRASAHRLGELQNAHAHQLGELRSTHAHQREDWKRAHDAVSRRLIEERLRLGAELEGVQQERDSLAQQFEGLRYVLAMLERSHSWRVTAPIRWSSRIVRRLVKGAE